MSTGVKISGNKKINFSLFFIYVYLSLFNFKLYITFIRISIKLVGIYEFFTMG